MGMKALRLEQPQAPGFGHGRRSGRDVEVAEDIGDVAVDGMLADEEPLGNRLVVVAGRYQPQNLNLPGRQAGPVRGA
jgi:hypothetical protein